MRRQSRRLLLGVLLIAHVGVSEAGGGPFTDNPTSVALLNNWIYTILILVTIAFDFLAHNFRHWLEHRAGVHARKHTYDKMPDPHSAAADLHLRIFTRFQGEMMTLGFLAFVVWVNNFAGTFQYIVEDYGIGSGADASSGSASAASAAASASGSVADSSASSSVADSSASSSSGSVADSSASSSGSSSESVGRMLLDASVRMLSEAASSSGSGSGSGSSSGSGSGSGSSHMRFSDHGSCNPAHSIPFDGPTLLHQVEAVHFALFIGMTVHAPPSPLPHPCLHPSPRSPHPSSLPPPRHPSFIWPNPHPRPPQLHVRPARAAPPLPHHTLPIP